MERTESSRKRLREARDQQDRARAEMAAAAVAAKAAGVHVQEIAELLGFKTRKAVYDLIRRGY